MFDLRNTRAGAGGRLGNTGLVPLKIETGRPVSAPEGNPVPIPMPVLLEVCGAILSAPVAMVGGIRPGATNRASSELVGAIDGPPLRAICIGSGRPMLIGVETVRAEGNPTGLSSGDTRRIPIATT